MGKISREAFQEAEYYFPYHYIDLASKEFKQIKAIDYLEKIFTIIKYSKINSNSNVLDIGCGDGRLIYEIKKHTSNIIGIDVSEKAINFAKAFNPQIKFIVGDITSKKISLEQEFSVITCVDVIEHLPDKKVKQVIDKAYDMLQPDGKLVISVPSTNLKLIPKHYKHYSTSELKKVVSTKFKKISIYGYLPKNNDKKVKALQAIGLLLYPLSQRYAWIDNYYGFMKNYLHNNFICNSDEGFGIIAICQK
jgi:2-polyprenyl-3-methyl-5-hydroxy-6-metoxy-1,4-benzoquinol methylase